jgi:hypothetical protein
MRVLRQHASLGVHCLTGATMHSVATSKDHDNRKLKKADRMKLVTKNKVEGTVRVFEQDSALEDAIGSHSCSLEANMRVCLKRTCV